MCSFYWDQRSCVEILLDNFSFFLCFFDSLILKKLVLSQLPGGSTTGC